MKRDQEVVDLIGLHIFRRGLGRRSGGATFEETVELVQRFEQGVFLGLDLKLNVAACSSVACFCRSALVWLCCRFRSLNAFPHVLHTHYRHHLSFAFSVPISISISISRCLVGVRSACPLPPVKRLRQLLVYQTALRLRLDKVGLEAV
jgi:hypothetical protein